MAFSAIAAIVGTVIAGVGAVQQRSATKKAQKAQRRQIALERKREQLRQRQAEFETARARRKSIREFRLARGQSINRLGLSGALEGSAAQGTVSSLNSQVASNIGFGATQQSTANQFFNLNEEIAQAKGSVNEAQSNIRQAQATSNFGVTVFNNAKTIGKVANSAKGQLFE